MIRQVVESWFMDKAFYKHGVFYHYNNRSLKCYFEPMADSVDIRYYGADRATIFYADPDLFKKLDKLLK